MCRTQIAEFIRLGHTLVSERGLREGCEVSLNGKKIAIKGLVDYMDLYFAADANAKAVERSSLGTCIRWGRAFVGDVHLI